jgi:hypothetical protein
LMCNRFRYFQLPVFYIKEIKTIWT